MLKNTIVVDVTYLCNATCRYCRWGDDTIPGRVAQDLDRVLIPYDVLDALDTGRVVISGGEPRLHPQISDILGYYREVADEAVVITNGYGLDRKSTDALLEAGATGITVSLDSVDAMESLMTRRTPPILHKKILRNLYDLSISGRRFELGINSTVSSVTANWITVMDILEFGMRLDVDFVKFQPIFDDGYVSVNSQDLLLSPVDVEPLLEVSARLETIGHPPTNPKEFWIDVARLAGGGTISPSGCALDRSDAILVGGDLGICYWVESSRYRYSDQLDQTSYDAAVSRFTRDKQKCKVGFHCFCNQGMGHAWQTD